jgi:hypothetical protein
MKARATGRILILSVVAGLLAIAAVPGVAGAFQALTCSSTTATIVQALGFPAAQVLVPASLPVRTCTFANGVQVVTPAFRVVGGTLEAPAIVPIGLPVMQCVSTVVIAQSPAPGTTSVVQVSQVPNTGVIVLNGAVTAISAPVLTCF